MERQVSHRHASSSSGGIHALAMQKPPILLARPLPNSACVQGDLMTMSFTDLLKVAKQLKHAGVMTTLRLFVSPNEQHIVNQRFSSLDHRTTDAVFEFTRALSRAIQGWMQDVEIGLSLWNRDLEVLSEAFGFSKTLRRLSFANSGLGDVRLQILAAGLRDCMPLQTLDLSGCALTDASTRCITVVVKSAVTRQAELEWKASLREPMSRNSSQDSYPANKICIGNLALAALDLSYNDFTDLLPRDLCAALRMGAPLHALNLRFNKMTRVGAKLLLDVMHEFNILRLVDLRDNEDEHLLGVLENGEHYTQFSSFQAPFWLDSLDYSTNSGKRNQKRDSETKHLDSRPSQLRKCSLPLPSQTTLTPLSKKDNSRSPSPSEDHLSPKFRVSEAAVLESSDGGGASGNTLRPQRPPKKGRPHTAPQRRIMAVRYLQKRSCGQENPRPNPHAGAAPSWDRDWVRKHMTSPGMIDPPREAVSEEPPKIFTNELYEIEEQKSTPPDRSTAVCETNVSSKKELGPMISFAAGLLRSTSSRSSTEWANNKRKIPDGQRRRSRRPSRTSRKSPRPDRQIARAKYLYSNVRNQKKKKPSALSVCEEQLTSSKDVKKEVEWHKFVSEMTETLLKLRDGLDKLIGATENDVDVLSITPRDANSKLPSDVSASGTTLIRLGFEEGDELEDGRRSSDGHCAVKQIWLQSSRGRGLSMLESDFGPKMERFRNIKRIKCKDQEIRI